MVKKHRVLVCPLNWGLGHATRCIPVIRELLNQNAEVIIAADKGPLALLKNEFSELEFIHFPGAEIIYPEKISLITSMLLKAPIILYHIFNEHQFLKNVIKNKEIDAVISDNRYGVWSKSIPSIFITHQVNIQSSFLQGLANKINHFFIKKYNECWIPDIEGKDNLAGNLSQNVSSSIRRFYIGPLSRFTNSMKDKGECKYDILVIISGPEKQRTVFENMIIRQLKQTNKKTLIVRGLPEAKKILHVSNKIELANHLSAAELENAISESKIIISRSGYSTIMDLVSLQKSAILIPTPGQTEQEYLAKRLKEKRIFYSVEQDDFNLESALKEAENYKIIQDLDTGNNLSNAIKKLLLRLS